MQSMIPRLVTISIVYLSIMSLQLLTLLSSLLLYESKSVDNDKESVTPVILIPGNIILY